MKYLCETEKVGGGWTSPAVVLAPIFAPDLGRASMLIAASTAFSAFGLMYCGVPILLIVMLATCLSAPTCRAFQLFLAGSLFFVVIFAIFVVVWLDNPQSYSRFTPDQQLAVAYAAACIGAAIGIVFRRLAAAMP
ncbi:MAG: hypothetical protein EA424_08455 [Planctomycetaceae bacterium]|nr:MAG: hypothetical protein EA424_08455 [Planctomycetaceae bacterium]